MRLSRIFAGACLAAASAAAAEPLTVVSWGGPYEDAQRTAIFAPFTEATGIDLRILSYGGSEAEMKRRAGSESWDVVDMTEDNAISACSAGLLMPMDARAFVVQDTDRPLHADFVDGAFRQCSVAQNVFAWVVAFDVSEFPGIKPRRIEDFFDLDRFPGKRGVHRSPDGILEWALMAEGVPPDQVYDLLSTDRGLKLAFSKLDEIRSHIIWWDDVAEPNALLESGEASMTTGVQRTLLCRRQFRRQTHRNHLGRPADRA